MLSKYRGTKSRSSLEASAPESDDSEPRASVFPSSTELFYFYAQILEQCANLFTGQPLYDLCQLQKKWLRIYAGVYFRTGSSSFVQYLRYRGGPCWESEAVRGVRSRLLTCAHELCLGIAPTLADLSKHAWTRTN